MTSQWLGLEQTGGTLISQVQQLEEMVHGLKLTSEGDRWVWNFGMNVNFMVMDLQKHIDDQILLDCCVATRCIKYIPSKVNIFYWRLWIVFQNVLILMLKGLTFLRQFVEYVMLTWKMQCISSFRVKQQGIYGFSWGDGVSSFSGF